MKKPASRRARPRGRRVVFGRRTEVVDLILRSDRGLADGQFPLRFARVVGRAYAERESADRRRDLDADDFESGDYLRLIPRAAFHDEGHGGTVLVFG